MKNTLKIMLSTIGILLYIWSFLVGTDIRRTTLNHQLPLFAVKSDTTSYNGLGYHINITYDEATHEINHVTIYLFDHVIAQLNDEANIN